MFPQHCNRTAGHGLLVVEHMAHAGRIVIIELIALNKSRLCRDLFLGLEQNINIFICILHATIFWRSRYVHR